MRWKEQIQRMIGYLFEARQLGQQMLPGEFELEAWRFKPDQPGQPHLFRLEITAPAEVIDWFWRVYREFRSDDELESCRIGPLDDSGQLPH